MFNQLCGTRHILTSLSFYNLRPLFLNKISLTFYNITLQFPKHLSTTIGNANLSSEKHLVFDRLSCLHDEEFHLQVKDLTPGSKVTLTSAIKDHRGHTYFTYTHYRADDSGQFDLKNTASLGGSYKGVFPMGPIAALSPGPNEHKYLRFVKKEVTQPLSVQFRLLKGHLEGIEAYSPSLLYILDSVIQKRYYMAPGVERIPVSVGKIRGTLFLPEGEGPFPGVVDLFGTAGGLMEFRSAQLASRGIASLALAYFAYDDLPKDINELDINYFAEGVQFLLHNKKIKKNGIGAVGISKGADLVCSMAAFIPEVKAVISINGIPVNTWCPLKTKHKTYPGLKFDLTRGKAVNPQLMEALDMMDDSDHFPETHIPLHESDAKFLFIVAMEDKNWHTERETMKAIERMKKHGKTNYEVLRCDNAGHLLEPCYAPFNYASYHRMAGVALLWGGTAQGHSAAQVVSWNKMISFFKNNL